MRFVVLFFISILSLPVAASGPNDGIYNMTTDLASGEFEYVTIHQNGDALVLIFLDPDDSTWLALQGIRQGDTTDFNLITEEGTPSVTSPTT